MPATPERSLDRIANEMQKITRVLEVLNQNFVTWANKNQPGNIEQLYVPVEGYAGGAPSFDHPARKLKEGE